MNKLILNLILILCVNKLVSSSFNQANNSSFNLLNHNTINHNVINPISSLSLDHQPLTPSLANLLNIQNLTNNNKFNLKNQDTNCKDVILSSSLYEDNCICTRDQANAIRINCDEIPILDDHIFILNPFLTLSFYTQRNAGMQQLATPLFSNQNGKLNLNTLDLSDNKLKKLISKLFDGLETNLEHLNLSGNLLGENLNPIYSTNEFLELKNLKSLNLGFNKLKNLDSNLFIGLKQLNVSLV